MTDNKSKNVTFNLNTNHQGWQVSSGRFIPPEETWKKPGFFRVSETGFGRPKLSETCLKPKSVFKTVYFSIK